MISLLCSVNYWCNLLGYFVWLTVLLLTTKKMILFVTTVFQYLITVGFYNNNEIDLFEQNSLNCINGMFICFHVNYNSCTYLY